MKREHTYPAAALAFTASLALAAAAFAQPAPIGLETIRDRAEKTFQHLLSRQQPNGMWRNLEGGGLEHDLGATALVCLALQAADRDRSEKAVAAGEAAIKANLDNIRSTYTLSLVIILLERRNQVVSALVPRLLSGQDPTSGGWSYSCPRAAHETADNSNTQLAVLALLVLRINGRLPPAADRALDLVVQRFRSTASPAGGWGYLDQPGGVAPGRTASMTCAGLLGLIAGVRDWNTEVVVRGSATGKDAAPRQDTIPVGIAELLKDPLVVKARDFLRSEFPKLNKHSPYLTYTLWSMERVAILFGDTTFYGDFDWYQFGVELLLTIQKPDGSWEQDFHMAGDVDTAFALLFIKRVNFLEVVISGRDSDLKVKGPGGIPLRPAVGERGTPKEAAALAKEMESALAARAETILAIMESKRDPAYRDALLEIVQNSNVRRSHRERALQALANWLSWHNPAKVAEYLNDAPWEMRVAAIRAVLVAEYRELIPKLIDKLTDSSSVVVDEAEYALRRLTQQDFGKDAAAWMRWYEKAPKKP